MAAIRALLVHPKEWDDAQVQAACQVLQSKYEAHAQSRARASGTSPDPVVITSGLVDYKKRAPNLGGYEGWRRSVTGKDAAGALRFTHLVFPSRRVGKASADIARAALSQGAHRVLYWDGADKITAVTRVSEHDGHDWHTGWALE